MSKKTLIFTYKYSQACSNLKLLNALSVSCRCLSKLIDYTLYALLKLHWHLKSCKLIYTETALSLTEERLVVNLAFKDLFTLVQLEPFDTLAVLPQTILDGLAGHLVRTESMLLAAAPVTLISASIRPGVDPIPMLLVVLVLTPILPPVLPSVHPKAIHIIIDPLALVLPPIEPCVGSKTLDFVLLPFASVPRAVIPAIVASTVFLSREILPLVD